MKRGLWLCANEVHPGNANLPIGGNVQLQENFVARGLF